MRVAVTGATGYVGQFVVADLLAHGHEVVAWTRPESARLLPAAVHSVEGRLGDERGCRQLLDGVQALVHLAFAHVPGRYRGGEGDDPKAFLDINLHGSLQLLEIARAMGVEACVLLSTRAVYDGAPGQPGGLDETVPPAPTTLYGAHKAALEAFVSAWGLGQGWKISALRPTGVYGLIEPFGQSKWVDLARQTLAGKPPATNRVSSEVHGADVAQAIRLLLEAPDVAGQVFNCSDLVLSTDRLVQHFAGTKRTAAAGTPSPRLMRTDKLRALGWRPGGEALLEATLAAMLERLT